MHKHMREQTTIVMIGGKRVDGHFRSQKAIFLRFLLMNFSHIIQPVKLCEITTCTILISLKYISDASSPEKKFTISLAPTATKYSLL